MLAILCQTTPRCSEDFVLLALCLDHDLHNRVLGRSHGMQGGEALVSLEASASLSCIVDCIRVLDMP